MYDVLHKGVIVLGPIQGLETLICSEIPNTERWRAFLDTSYNPRHVPAIRQQVDWNDWPSFHITMYRMGAEEMVEGKPLARVAVTLDTMDGFCDPAGWWLNDERGML